MLGKSSDVYTASDEPPRVSMDLHNEMAYMSYWPDYVSTAGTDKLH